MKLCPPEKCTGCLACVNCCPHKAFTVSRDVEGFYIPVVNEALCTDCKLCEKKCPVLHPVKRIRIEQYGYASWSKDPFIRRYSSSGGIFSVLARAIFERSGIVVGVVIDEKLEVRHVALQSEEDLKFLRGSKYVQSYSGNIYREVKEYLLLGREVLFSGTPCQIAALYSFLGKEYINLFTIDLICHGVPSPEIFGKYITWLENKYGSTVKEYLFRDKQKSWCWFNTKAIFDNGKVYIGTWFKDPFMRIFLRDYILRPCCYSCEYTNMQRMGDITIADFWGYKARDAKERDTDKGISLVIVNTGKGEELFNCCKDELFYFRRDYEDIQNTQRSLSVAWKIPDGRIEFWKDYKVFPFDKVLERYGYPAKRTIVQFLESEFGRNRLTQMIIWGGLRMKRLMLRILRNKSVINNI